MRIRSVSMIAAAVMALVGCGAGQETVVGTLEGVGDLPAPLSAGPNDLGRGPMERARILATRDEVRIAELIEGPRVMVIGDSIFASAARRYGNEICTALTARGWDVEVNAEVGRFVDFGERVLAKRLQPANGLDWDAFVVSLGSNFGGDLSAYRSRLIRLLDRVESRPVLMFTVSEFMPDRVKLNDVIVEMVRLYPNVFVVDWSAIVAADAELLQRDRLHLTEAGRIRLANEMARALGTHDPGREGRCLPTEFSDDSAISGSEDASIVTPPSRSASSTTLASEADAGEDQTGDEPAGEDQTGEDQTGEDQTGDDETGDPAETSIPATTLPTSTVPTSAAPTSTAPTSTEPTSTAPTSTAPATSDP